MNHNGDPTTRTRRGLRLAIVAATILPAACAETTAAPSKAPVAISAHMAANQQIGMERAATRVTTPEPSPSTSTPEVTLPEVEYAEPAEVEKDVQAMVTMIDAMDPYNREDIKVTTTGNPDGSYTQSFTKITNNFYAVPTALTAAVVYGPNQSGAPASTDSIEAISFRISPVNLEDVIHGGNTSAITVSRIGDEHWAFNVSDNDVTYLHASTEPNTGKGADNRVRLDEENSAMFALSSNITDLNNRLPYIFLEVPVIGTAPVEPESGKLPPAL